MTMRQARGDAGRLTPVATWWPEKCYGVRRCVSITRFMLVRFQPALNGGSHDPTKR